MDIEKIIEEFNKKYKTNCKLILKEPITVLFKGHICFTCGTYDYFEDLKYMLEEKLNKKLYIQYEEINGNYIVKYLEKPPKYKKEIKIIFYE